MSYNVVKDGEMAEKLAQEWIAGVKNDTQKENVTNKPEENELIDENLPTEADEQLDEVETVEEVPVEKEKKPTQEKESNEKPLLNPNKENDLKYLKDRTLTALGITKRQAEEIKGFKESNKAFERQIEELKTQMNSIQAKPTKEELEEAPIVSSEVTDADLEREFGTLTEDYDREYLVQTVKGRNKIYDKINSLSEQIEFMKQENLKLKQKQTTGNFWSNVYGRLPQAKGILDNPAFEAWLDEPMRYGKKKFDLYDDAYKSANVDVVTEIFKDFLDETTSENNDSGKISDEIRKQVTPDSTQPTRIGKKDKGFMRTSEIDKFFKLERKGKYTVAQSNEYMKKIRLANEQNKIIKDN